MTDFLTGQRLGYVAMRQINQNDTTYHISKIYVHNIFERAPYF